MGDALEFSLDRGDGREDGVVLVRAPGGRPFLGEDADDPTGHALDHDRLADGIDQAEQLARDRLTEQADLTGPRHLSGMDQLAVQQRPASYPEVRRSHAVDGGSPIRAPIAQLGGVPHACGDVDHIGQPAMACASARVRLVLPPTPVHTSPWGTEPGRITSADA